MVTSSIIKHLLSDKDSLADYLKGNAVSFEMLKQRLLLLERQENRHIPDHYYRLNEEKSFDKIDSVGETIRIGLYRLSEEYLELRENRIYVKQEKQNQWQELITYIPPLILQMAFLHIKKPLTDKSETAVIEYFNEYILPNARYTALPYPYIPQIEHYIKSKNGLHDLHMHLNGSTETDSAWQDFLSEPDLIYTELKAGLKQTKVKEQFEQESYIQSPLEFRNILLNARSIREYLYKMIFPFSVEWEDLKIESVKDIIHYIINSGERASNEENPFISTSAHSPFASLVCKENPCKCPMAVEGLMYVLTLDYIATSGKESFASMFHFYLLTLGLANRLLVQQVHQFGFEQFQKITLNELRGRSEKSYKRRFFQLHGNSQRNIRFLEGRFSPKPTRQKNIILINSINKGWDDLLKSIQGELALPQKELPILKLTAHFIKEKDNDPDVEIRHKKLRYEVWQKAYTLALLKKNDANLMEKVIAIDAAASEFDAPPEVFAPSFRYLRRHGFKHFTYHAGEDFFHLISGLRAIYEAVLFNDLKCGDRIGHATATGVSPEIWIRNVGKNIFIRQGEYLDDLLFAYHLIISSEKESLKEKLPLLINEIHELSHLIYRKSYSLKTLESAWMFRRFCPALLFAGSKETATTLGVFESEEWNDIEENVFNGQKKDDERVELLRKYHCINFRKEYNKIIKIETEKHFNVSDLELLQLEVLKYLHDKEIVIETLPTSNVRIGQHFNFDTYHLWNWMKWEKEGNPIPPIVVGTDDTGIFATNIYNEYANIYCNLVYCIGTCQNEAMRIIEQLDRNGEIYRFE